MAHRQRDVRGLRTNTITDTLGCAHRYDAFVQIFSLTTFGRLRRHLCSGQQPVATLTSGSTNASLLTASRTQNDLKREKQLQMDLRCLTAVGPFDDTERDLKTSHNEVRISETD